MAHNKATITTKAVAWAADVPIKYQSALELKVSYKRIMRISGDPMATEEQALDSLKDEYRLWQRTLDAFGKVLNK